MDRKAVFEEKFRTLIKEKGRNAQIFPTSQQDQMITDISRIQSDGPKSENKLICLDKYGAIRCIASAAYQNIGHGREKERFKKHRINGLTSHAKHAICLPRFPPVSTNVMSRGQVDVINFQALLDVKTGRSGIKAARNLHNLLWLFCNPTTVKCHNAPSSAIITELKTCWPELKLVTGLKFVQWQIYVSVHETTGQSPFKLMQTEEEVKGFLAFQEEANEKESLNRDEKTYKENESIAEKTFLHRDQAFIKAQEEAAEMKRRFTKMLKPLHIGQNATLRVPDVDRGPADPKNFLLLIYKSHQKI
ncbi:hypothetical protein T06_6692 [Trichinella sp. T6]|nr:hypothetical protein T06_6692 [Trichinella sp. T6]